MPFLRDTVDSGYENLIAAVVTKLLMPGNLSKSEMAHRMRTSGPAVDRLLDPVNPSVTLSTLERAAAAVGKRLRVELVSPPADCEQVDDRILAGLTAFRSGR